MDIIDKTTDLIKFVKDHEREIDIFKKIIKYVKELIEKKED